MCLAGATKKICFLGLCPKWGRAGGVSVLNFHNFVLNTLFLPRRLTFSAKRTFCVLEAPKWEGRLPISNLVEKKNFFVSFSGGKENTRKSRCWLLVSHRVVSPPSVRHSELWQVGYRCDGATKGPTPTYSRYPWFTNTVKVILLTIYYFQNIFEVSL